jgi:hypothetical protein
MDSLLCHSLLASLFAHGLYVIGGRFEICSDTIIINQKFKRKSLNVDKKSKVLTFYK